MAIGYSHHNYNATVRERHRYFLKSHRIGAFPIAYKPQAPGMLYFFFSTDEPSDFAHRRMLQYEDGGGPVGTILPNYYSGDGPTSSFSQLNERMYQIGEVDDAEYHFDSTDGMLDPGLFKKFIPFEITQEEVDAYQQGGDDELRLFHLIKNEELELGKNYHFLAVMYYFNDTNSEFLFDEDQLNYADDNAALGNLISLPKQMNDLQGNRLSFADAALLTVEHGEPDDPNWLKITDICRGGDDYQLTFTLQFCNQSTFPANGANIVLEGLRKEKPDGTMSTESIFSCYRLLNITPNLSRECCTRYECRADKGCFDHELSSVDEKYSLIFDESQLLAAPEPDSESCGNIVFSVTVAPTYLPLLLEKPVMKYCVNLYGDIDTDTQTICGANDVLNRELIVDTVLLDQFSRQRLESNPIWDNREDGCEQAYGCDNSFQLDRPRPFFLLRWWRCLFNSCCRE